MSNPSANVAALAFLDHYLDHGRHGEGVVLINGPWGTGKTYSLLEYLKSRDDRRVKAEPLSDRHIYVTLHGVSSIDQVYERLFSAKHPIGAKAAKGVETVASRAALLLNAGQGITASDGAAIRRYLLSLRDAVLVFDDLERMTLPVNQFMGWLNTLVEHEKIKAILVADETRIPDFVAGKEKLVTRTLVLKSSTSEVYDALRDRMRCPEASAAARAAKDKAVSTMEATGSPNLRTLRAVLDDFDRLTVEVGPDLRGSPAALGILLPIMIVLWTGVRVGELTVADFDQETNAFYELFLMRSRQEDTPPSPAVMAIARHPGMDFMDAPAPVQALVRYASTGELDVDAIDAAAAQHHAVAGLLQISAWRRVYRWRNLDAAEFAAAVDELHGELAYSQVIHPDVLLHLMGTALDLAHHGYDLFEHDPLQALTDYSETLLAKDLLLPVLDGLDSFGSTTGLGYSCVEHSDFGTFRVKLQALVVVARDRAVQVAAPKLLQQLSAGDLRPLLEQSFDDGLYAAIPVLHHIPVGHFADLLVTGGVANRDMRTALLQRYSRWGEGAHPLAAEATWVIALEAELRTRSTRLAPPHRRFVEAEMKTLFRKICAVLEGPKPAA